MSLVEAYQEHYQDAASPAPRQEAIQLDELSEAFATPEKGRWHTDDFKQKEAYIRYGKLIAEKLNLQLTYPEIPWLQAPKAIPHNSHGDAYQGKDALVFQGVEVGFDVFDLLFCIIVNRNELSLLFLLNPLLLKLKLTHTLIQFILPA